MRIQPVDPRDSAALERFVALPERLFAGDPRFVPPIRAATARDIAGAGAFGRYGRLQAFVAEDDRGEARGRIAAIVNPRLRGASGAPLGQVGHFACADDPAAAAALFDAAFAWLRAEGAREVAGPIDGGAHRSHRVLVEGFERPPFLFEPRNPPYVPRLFEAAGFVAVRAWRSHDLDRAGVEVVLDALRAGADRARRRFRLDIVDTRDIPAALARIHPLLDGAWEGHTGYASFDLEECVECFAGLLAVMTPGDLVVAVDEEAGGDVGFCFGFPDWADEARAIAGDASRWGAWLGAGRAAPAYIPHTVAVLPEVRRTGVAHLLMQPIFERALVYPAERYVVALVDDDFKFFAKTVPATRTYVLYARAL